MSFAIATTILRKFSACFSSWVFAALYWDSFVTPSTRSAISGPNSSAISFFVASVSSIVSWRSPVTTDDSSSFSSARMPATSSGWTRYGSPDLRSCPVWTLAL